VLVAIVIYIQSPVDNEQPQTKKTISPYVVKRIFQRLISRDYKTVYKGPTWKSCFCLSKRSMYLYMFVTLIHVQQCYIISDKMLSYRTETALRGTLALAKSGRLELGDNISRTV